LWPNGRRGVDGKTAIAKRGEHLHTFVAQEVFTLQQAKYFVSEQLFRGGGVDIGDRCYVAVPMTAREGFVSA